MDEQGLPLSIAITTRRLLKSGLMGDYTSAFKGVGLEFHQIREYSPGDDVRFIDWNASAKSRSLMVKQFIEERDRSIILVLDCSASMKAGTAEKSKNQYARHLALWLAHLAHYSKDKVGLLLFSDKNEIWMPPSKKGSHFAQLCKTIKSHSSQRQKTEPGAPLATLAAYKKQAIVFWISDFILPLEKYTSSFSVISKQYDVVALRLIDEKDTSLPWIGLVPFKDLETDTDCLIKTDTSEVNQFLEKRLQEQKNFFLKSKIDLVDLFIKDSFVLPLVSFFKQRTRRQI